jgi:hypothetical protein
MVLLPEWSGYLSMSYQFVKITRETLYDPRVLMLP